MGYLTVIRSLVGVSNLFFEILETTIAREAGKRAVDSFDSMRALLRSVNLWGVVVFIIVAAVIALLGGDILRLIYGGYYYQYGLTLLVLWFSQWGTFLSKVDAVRLRTERKTLMPTFGFLGGIVATLISAPICLEKWGVLGGAITIMLGSYGVYVTQRFVAGRRWAAREI